MSTVANERASSEALTGVVSGPTRSKHFLRSARHLAMRILLQFAAPGVTILMIACNGWRVARVLALLHGTIQLANYAIRSQLTQV